MSRRTLHRGTQVVLNTWIYQHQDAALDEIKQKTGKSKADLVREALTIYLNTMKEERVLGHDKQGHADG